MGNPVSWAQQTPPAPTRIERYQGADQDDTFNSFAEDARRAARAGYEAVGHTWEGETLVVTYKFVAVPRKGASRLSGLSLPALGILLGGALVAFGPVLPWLSAVDQSGVAVSRSGVEGADGLITIFVGLFIALLGRTMARGQNLQRATTTLISSVGIFIFIVLDYVNISQLGTVGPGVWVVVVGAVLASVSGLRVRSTA